MSRNPDAERSVGGRFLDLARDLWYAVVAVLAGPVPRDRGVILLYHEVSAHPHPLCVDPAGFERQMEFLARHFRVVPLDHMQTLLGQPSDRPLAALTFDDGYRGNFDAVRPVLRRLGFPATFFVPSGWVGREEFSSTEPLFPTMTWTELETLQADGFALGSHTATHPELDRLSYGEALEEIARGRRDLEERLGRPAPDFAYPRGCHNEDTVRAATDAGCRLALTVERGTVGRGDHALRLRRVGVGRHIRFPHFRALVSAAVDRPRWMGL